MMLAVIRNANISKSVIDIFSMLEDSIFLPVIKKLFPIILTDNSLDFRILMRSKPPMSRRDNKRKSSTAIRTHRGKSQTWKTPLSTCAKHSSKERVWTWWYRDITSRPHAQSPSEQDGHQLGWRNIRGKTMEKLAIRLILAREVKLVSKHIGQ